MILLSVGNSDIFVGGLDEVLPEFIFKFGGGSISLNGFEVFVELELVELFLLELFKGLLNGELGGVVEELLVFFIFGSFHSNCYNWYNRINENTDQRASYGWFSSEVY